VKLSVVIPAQNEQHNVGKCVRELAHCLRGENLDFEILCVDDNSTDRTADIVNACIKADASIRLIQRQPPAGFGRAIRAGLSQITGDVAVIYMADLSDHPEDALAYYRTIEDGYDCVFGSRFIEGSQVENYPPVKLVWNRVVNRCVQLLFWTKCNDLTNAFKAYRKEVIEACQPLRADDFDISLEMSLGALIRGCRVAQIPIRWSGRTWGSSKLSLRQMGRRYLRTLIRILLQWPTVKPLRPAREQTPGENWIKLNG
jgi:dolichol-phosphate mannosyltransferase